MGNYNGREFNQKNSREKVNSQFFFDNDLRYKSEWIKGEADKELIEFAEKAGRFMAENGLTSSKIRSIYGEMKRIQMGQFEKEKSSFFLLKPKVAYAFGREMNNEGLKLFYLVFNKSFNDVNDYKTYQNFCNMVEAILAYHKVNNGQ